MHASYYICVFSWCLFFIDVEKPYSTSFNMVEKENRKALRESMELQVDKFMQPQCFTFKEDMHKPPNISNFTNVKSKTFCACV